jgi:hypothetical protein
MSDEEKAEMQQMRDLFAGIALPGVIMRGGLLSSSEDFAIRAYDIAEAMIVERNKRLEDERNSNVETEGNS